MKRKVVINVLWAHHTQGRNTVTGAWRENTVTATIARYFPVVIGACLCLCAFLCLCVFLCLCAFLCFCAFLCLCCCDYCKVFPLCHWCLQLWLILTAIQMDNTGDQLKGMYSKTSSVTQMHTWKYPKVPRTFFSNLIASSASTALDRMVMERAARVTKRSPEQELWPKIS